MLMPSLRSSRAVLARLDSKRSFCSSCVLCQRIAPFSRPFRAPLSSSEEEESPKKGKGRQLDELRTARIDELAAQRQEERKRTRRQDVFISVYLSVSENGSSATYTGVTYDVMNALRADNGEKERGIPFVRSPRGTAPHKWRPYRLSLALGGFNSAAAAKQFLKAWQWPAQSKYLLASGVEPLPLLHDKRGVPLSNGKREHRGLVPKAGEAFFYDSSIDTLVFKMAVLQRLVTCSPFNSMPLRLAFYDNESAKTWQQALEGNFPGGTNDALRLLPGQETPAKRLAAIELQRRFPLRADALAYLQPVKQSPSLPFTGSSGERKRKTRDPEAMVRSILQRKPLLSTVH